MHVMNVQTRMVNGMIHIRESDPSAEIFLTPTVPITCPQSEMWLQLKEFVGLDITDCDVHFTEPLASQTIKVKALKTTSSFARVAEIKFGTIESPGSPWDGYTPAHCPVSSRLKRSGLRVLLCGLKCME